MRLGRCSTKAKLAIVASVAIAGAIGTSINGYADSPTGPAARRPAVGTPYLNYTGTMEQVRQLVPCGQTMYAVGTFTSIVSGTTVYTRNNIFSFSATSPFAVTSFNPNVNGIVDSIAFNGTDCATAYIGGKFTAVGDTAVKNLAAVDTATGADIPTFKSKAPGEVFTLVGWNGHIFAGGAFATINGSSNSPYFASLNPVTGKNDNYLQLAISGKYTYQDLSGRQSSDEPTKIYNQQLSHDGTKDMVEGVFTTIGGQSRRQVAILDLGATTATTDAWHAAQLDENCATVEPFYTKAAAWSPDDNTVYIASTGYKPATSSGYNTSQPRTGLCDSASSFSATSGEVTSNWINYSGCDSLYSTVADNSTAYFGGHERWADNPDGCDAAGPGAVAAPGIVGLSPTDGSITYNPTRSRGQGADDMIVTDAGLWVADDNKGNLTACGKKHDYAGICFLPYPAPVS